MDEPSDFKFEARLVTIVGGIVGVEGRILGSMEEIFHCIVVDTMSLYSTTLQVSDSCVKQYNK